MAHTLQTARAPAPECEPPSSHWRCSAYRIGDCLFLIVIGLLTSWLMRMMHALEWGFAVCAVVGMLVAMFVQTLAAWIIAPLLGSIESMVPSMLVAMVSPMSICVLHWLGAEPGTAWSLLQGAVMALGVFLFLEVYGTACRRRFERWGRDEVRDA